MLKKVMHQCIQNSKITLQLNIKMHLPPHRMSILMPNAKWKIGFDYVHSIYMDIIHCFHVVRICYTHWSSRIDTIILSDKQESTYASNPTKVAPDNY